MASELLINHWIDASPQRMWEVFTTPELFHRFFSPAGLTIPVESVVLDMRVGGRFECVMFDGNDEVSRIGATLTAVDPPHQFTFDEPTMGITSTHTFTADCGGTLIGVVQRGFPPEVAHDPEVLAAFRSSYAKLGTLIGASIENR